MSTQKSPDLIRLYIKSCVIGFIVSAVFVTLLIGFDVAGVGHLILGSDMGLIAAVMMWVFNGIVFAGVQFGIAIMSMGDDDDDHHGGHRSRASHVLVPIPVRSDDRRL